MKFQPLKVGDIVKRSPDWKWNNQDHDSNGNCVNGKVMRAYNPSKYNFSVDVKWKDGVTETYRYTNAIKDVVLVNQNESESSSKIGIFETFFLNSINSSTVLIQNSSIISSPSIKTFLLTHNNGVKNNSSIVSKS